MKIKKINAFFISSIAVFSLFFSTDVYARAFKSQSINGTTGLITTPTGHVGWEDSDFGFDIGYHHIEDRDQYDDKTRVPKVSVTLFKKLELGAAYDMQPEINSQKNDDLIFHGKFQFYDGGGTSAIAIGGNYQKLKFMDEDFKAYQAYLVATYSGQLLGMFAETTLVFGKHWGDEPPVNSDDIDFSMGFDLNLLPSLFKGYIHWISDFSNYSYSLHAFGSNTYYRGAFNTGIRIGLLRDSKKYKLNIDAIFTDTFDENRGFTIGGTCGLNF